MFCQLHVLSVEMITWSLCSWIHRRKDFHSLFPKRQNDLVESRGLSSGSATLWSSIGALGVLKYVHKLWYFEKYSSPLCSCELSDCFLMNRIWQSVVAWHSRWRCKRRCGSLSDSLGSRTLGTVAAMLRGHSSSSEERLIQRRAEASRQQPWSEPSWECTFQLLANLSPGQHPDNTFGETPSPPPSCTLLGQLQISDPQRLWDNINLVKPLSFGETFNIAINN